MEQQATTFHLRWQSISGKCVPEADFQYGEAQDLGGILA
jgi:hypothetical protein